MKRILKMVLAILSGTGIAAMVLGLADWLNRSLFPSAISHPTLAEQTRMIQEAAWSELIILLAGYTLSSFFGAYVAARVAPEGKKWVCGLGISFLILLGLLFYFILFPFPMLFMILSCILLIPSAWLAIRLAGSS